MKKALKYVMLALLVVPCALVFTACNKNLSANDFTKYVFDAYNKQVATETYDKWEDVNVTVTAKYGSVETVKLTYLATEGDESSETTKEYTNEQTTTSTTTFVRAGQGKDTVVKVEMTSETTTKEYSVDGEKNTLKTTDETTTRKVTAYIGRESNEYVVTLTTTTKQGTAEAVTTNQKETLADESAFQTAVENLSKNYFEASLTEAYETVTPTVTTADGELVKAGYAELLEFKYSKNGNKVTATGCVDNVAYGLGSLYNGEAKLESNSERLTNFELNMTIESYNNDGYVETTTMNNGVNVKYETVKLTLPDATEYSEGQNLLQGLGMGF